MKWSMTLIIFVAFLITAAAAGEKRYVVASRTQFSNTFESYPIWTDASWPRNCTRAFISGTKEQQKEFCEDGFAAQAEGRDRYRWRRG